MTRDDLIEVGLCGAVVFVATLAALFVRDAVYRFLGQRPVVD
jgi:hypothetical protein